MDLDKLQKLIELLHNTVNVLTVTNAAQICCCPTSGNGEPSGRAALPLTIGSGVGMGVGLGVAMPPPEMPLRILMSMVTISTILRKLFTTFCGMLIKFSVRG